MSYFDHDPEVPAGYQDADIEQAELEAAGRRLARLHARGICTHGWRLGGGACFYDAAGIERMRAAGRFPDRPTDPSIRSQADIPADKDLCTDCGQLVPTWG